MIYFVSASETPTLGQVRKQLEIETGSVSHFQSLKSLYSKLGHTLNGVVILHYPNKDELKNDSDNLIKLKKLKQTQNLQLLFIHEFDSIKMGQFIYKLGFDEILPKHVLVKTLKLKIQKAFKLFKYRINQPHQNHIKDIVVVKTGQKKNLQSEFNQSKQELDLIGWTKPNTSTVSQTNKKTDLFKSVLNNKEKQAYLNTILEKKVTGILWTQGQKFKVPVNIKSVLSKKMIAEFPKDITPEKMIAELKKSKTKTFFVNFNLPQCSIFFEQPLETVFFAKTSYVIPTPALLWRVQRRSYERLQFSPHIIKKVDFTWKNKTNLNILTSKMIIRDLSAGGCCVYFPDNDKNANSLKVGDTIQFLEFILETKKIKCQAEVRWVKKIKINGVSKNALGVQFIEIEEEQWRTIFLYVIEHLFTQKDEHS